MIWSWAKNSTLIRLSPYNKRPKSRLQVVRARLRLGLGFIPDDRSGYKRLFWKSLGKPNPAYEEKKEELKQVNRGRARPRKVNPME